MRAHPSASWETIITAASAASARISRAPIALWYTELDHNAMHLAEHAPIAGLRAFISGPSVDYEILRAELCRLELMDRHVVSWFRRRGIHVETPLEAVVAMLLTARDPPTTIRAVLKSCGHGYHSWIRSTGVAGFTRSEDAFHMLRLLRTCVEIQAYPHKSLAELADAHGYWDAAALRSRMRLIMGSTPTEVRQHLGWEWLLYQALRRAGLHLR